MELHPGTDKSGHVVFVDNGTLEIHNRIALTLRF